MVHQANENITYRELRRFIRFAIVGLLGTGVDFGLFFVLKGLLGLPTVLANTFSYSAGILNNSGSEW